MVILHTCARFLQSPCFPLSSFSRQENCSPPFWAVRVPFQSFCGQPKTCIIVAKAGRGLKLKTQKENEGEEVGYGDDEEDEADDGFSSRSGFVGRGEGKEFDRDPEFAEIMGACLDDPQKARSKVSPFFFLHYWNFSANFHFLLWEVVVLVWFLQFWCLCF